MHVLNRAKGLKAYVECRVCERLRHIGTWGAHEWTWAGHQCMRIKDGPCDPESADRQPLPVGRGMAARAATSLLRAMFQASCGTGAMTPTGYAPYHGPRALATSTRAHSCC